MVLGASTEGHHQAYIIHNRCNGRDDRYNRFLEGLVMRPGVQNYMLSRFWEDL